MKSRPSKRKSDNSSNKEISLGDINFQTAKKLNKHLYGASERGGKRSFRLKASLNSNAWPNSCVPIAAVIAYYQGKGLDLKCSWANSDSLLAHTRIHDPLSVRSELIGGQRKRVLGTVWKYSEAEEVHTLVDTLISELVQKDALEPGVLQGVEWCLNETMDNVLQHSQSEEGFFMAAYETTNKRLSVCVFDNGIGLYNSLRGTECDPSGRLDAITKALQEGVTRDKSIGQGNGMWGLSRIVAENGGSYAVFSDGACYRYENGETNTLEDYQGVYFVTEHKGTTMVDFQLECSRSIDVATALNGHAPVQLWLEALEGNIEGEYVIQVAKQPDGTGTRRAGERLRNMAVNVLREGHGSKVILDFANVSVISSSYADELIGKLVAMTGFCSFSDHFCIAGLSPSNKAVVDRSVQQRMAQVYYGEIVPEGDY